MMRMPPPLLCRWLALSLSLFLILPATAAEPAATKKNSKLTNKSSGSLLMVGGGKISDPIRTRFLELAGGKKAKLVVVPTASARIDRGEVSSSYLFWRAQDVTSVDVLHTRSREQASDPTFLQPLESATGVWLGGGDQSRLTETYLGTGVLRELKKVLERGGVVGGTSAGASVMSEIMVTGGTTRATTGQGFGFLPGFIVDQHFTNRNRLGRLMSVLPENPELAGLGIDEATAALVQGDAVSVVGDANIWLCLPATTSLPSSVQRFKHGEQIDLPSLSDTMQVRNRTSLGQSTVSTVPAPKETMSPMKAR